MMDESCVEQAEQVFEDGRVTLVMDTSDGPVH